MDDHYHVTDRGGLYRAGGPGAGRYEELIAYSSISHMGFVTLGFFVCSIFSGIPAQSQVRRWVLRRLGANDLARVCLRRDVLCVGVMYDRMHTRNISDYGGVVNTMPKFAALMVFFAWLMPDCRNIRLRR